MRFLPWVRKRTPKKIYYGKDEGNKMKFNYTKDELWLVADKRGISFERMDGWDVKASMHTFSARWIVFIDRLKRVVEVWK